MTIGGKDTYYTIDRVSEGIFKDRGSKFIARAYPVTGIEEIRSILDDLRREFHDARHHCYAYRINPASPEYRINDDGEPSGTAGKPIYGQIRSYELHNVLVVVVRYFGGTKLGVGGLIQAYKKASQEALEQAQRITKTLDTLISVLYPYPAMGEVMRILREEEAGIILQDFQLECRLEIRIRNSRYQQLISRLKLVEKVQIRPVEGV